jgi:Rap1a immunity proteins
MLRSQVSLSGFVLIAALMLSGSSALAEDKNSANFMMPSCRKLLTNDDSEPYLQGICYGIIKTLYFMGGGKCAPSGVVTVSQNTRVVVQYIDARPARMHEDFRELALEAMKAAWPCRR